MFNNNLSKSAGVSRYLTIMLLTGVFVLAVGISALFTSRLRTLVDIGDSVPAFYAAETGIERALYEQWTPSPSPSPHAETLDNGASYQVWVMPPGGECTATEQCVKSIGEYRNVRRGIKISR
jgi:hypothetical protein